MRLLRSFITCCWLLLIVAMPSARAQVRVSGTVYDMSRSVPLDAVSVLSSSGNGTFTDSMGRYTLLVHETDSIWFSYLNKPTGKFPVKSIPDPRSFDISLHVSVAELSPVQVKPRDYRLDSIQNREDYAKVFNFRKPGIDVSMSPGGGVGLDLDALISMFQFKRNRRMLSFQRRLLEEEKDKYIDHRFNRGLVIRLTGLMNEQLDTFMVRYRPTLDFTQMSTDYEFQLYIKKCYEHYREYLRLMGEIKEEEKE